MTRPLRLSNIFILLMGLTCAMGVACGEKRQGPKAATPKTAPPPDQLSVATFAGGCFWCMEPPFDALDGVYATISGYMGGHTDKPTYRQVSAGTTGHTEVVQVHYDPRKLTYERLLEVFWRNIDPLVENRQFCDVGSQYRSAIFSHTPAQARLAQASKQRLEASGLLQGPIRTELTKAGTFFSAEEYHQDFYLKEPKHYKRYRSGCGRDARLRQLWEQVPKSP